MCEFFVIMFLKKLSKCWDVNNRCIMWSDCVEAVLAKTMPLLMGSDKIWEQPIDC